MALDGAGGGFFEGGAFEVTNAPADNQGSPSRSLSAADVAGFNAALGAALGLTAHGAEGGAGGAFEGGTGSTQDACGVESGGPWRASTGHPGDTSSGLTGRPGGGVALGGG